jgi:hypothetical protein
MVSPIAIPQASPATALSLNSLLRKISIESRSATFTSGHTFIARSNSSYTQAQGGSMLDNLIIRILQLFQKVLSHA